MGIDTQEGDKNFLEIRLYGIRHCVSIQNQPHDVVGASREANREGSGGEGGGYGQSDVRAVSPKRGENPHPSPGSAIGVRYSFFMTPLVCTVYYAGALKTG
jgi:hypothetical protein